MLALAYLAVLVSSGVARILKLDLVERIIISTSRAFLQLSLLGYILVPLFTINSPVLVVSYVVFMMFISSLEASGNCVRSYKGMLRDCFTAISLAAGGSVLFAIFVVLRQGLDAQYTIPLMGMALGNSLTGCSVVLQTVMLEFTDRKDDIERFLALGATRWEAADPIFKRAVTLGTTPGLNQASVAGIVAIPGMVRMQPVHPSFEVCVLTPTSTLDDWSNTRRDFT
mmetsp:Transcript_17257/g.35833  ORF Transcript_17257/g.35833 Transcript_17257/m.35833 type:complete len:226 (+) Transcript_17257:1191-1868(+)